jgi:PhnB protein
MTREACAVPYLCVRNAPAALEFYKKAFGAEEVMRLSEPTGKVGHAEISIEGARVMLADEYPEHDHLSPESIGGTPVTIALNVSNVDGMVERARGAGAKVLRPPTDEFYGERSAKVADPFGHVWHIATTKEELSAEEMQRRYDELLAKK